MIRGLASFLQWLLDCWDDVVWVLSVLWWSLRRKLSGRRPRRPGEIVARSPGSCFCAEEEPRFVRLTGEGDEELHEVSRCMGLCSDPYCREWAYVQIVEGEHRGEWMCHLSECEMSDPTPEDWARYDAERQTALAPAEAGEEASDGE